ncbi:MAG: hypothetical protein R3D65_03480 [Zhengella sp.]|uniref:hypothetical protein n=1 Tax=Zhengella sp. TaxID=2282762 RepID=UPI001E05A98C|nr:hypothetical protein [Notoacmeibacter sp.]MCC0026200.1 hypothetical protein [Brucellaceae bacterium]
MKFLLLTGGLLLAATGAHAGMLPNGTPVTQISASVFLMGAPAEPVEEPASQAAAPRTVKVAARPTALMSLDEIIGERPEVMNKPRAIADLAGPEGEDGFPGQNPGNGFDTASAGGVPAPGDAPVDIDENRTAAVNPPAAPDFRGMELRRE